MGQITIREVAQAAGFSTATAADILRHDTQRSYRPATISCVQEAAQRLGYEANGVARLLRQKKTNLVGLAINSTCPYLNPLVQATSQALKEKGYEPIFMEIGPGNSVSSFFNVQMLAGMISADTKMMWEVPEFYEELHHKLPVIALYPIISKRMDCITTDRLRLVELAVEHLASLGHRRIAFAEDFATNAPTNAAKVEGWKRASAKFPIDPDPRCQIPFMSGASAEKGQTVATALMQIEPAPTALLCEEEVALHAMRRLQKIGWRIPQRLSVVGYGRSGHGEFCYPSLTTVLPPLEEVGRIAVKRMVERIEAASQGKSLRPLRRFVEPQLVVRESTASPG